MQAFFFLERSNCSFVIILVYATFVDVFLREFVHSGIGPGQILVEILIAELNFAELGGLGYREHKALW